MRLGRSTGLITTLVAAGLLASACAGGGLDAEPSTSTATSQAADVSQGAVDGTITVGFVSPLTGPLSAFAEADEWVIEQMTAWFGENPIQAGGKSFGVDIIVKDSQSDPKRAGEVAAELINSDQVDVLMAVAAPETTVPVTLQCEANEVPCITSSTPWQAWYLGSGGTEDKPLKWSHHAFWGFEAVTAVFQDMWGQVETNKKVAGLFPNDADGTAWANSIPDMVAANGYEVINPGLFAPETQDFTAQIAAFKDADAQILVGVVPPPTFATFWQQAKQQGYNPKVVTVGKAVEFPSAVGGLGDLAQNLGVGVWWAPSYPTSSSLTGVTSADFAAAYNADTGKQWTMALPFSEVLFEVLNAAVEKAGTVDQGAINEALKGLKVSTLAGDLDWSAGPTPNVAVTMLTGGQWRSTDGGEFPFDITITSNAISPSVPTGGTMEPIS